MSVFSLSDWSPHPLKGKKGDPDLGAVTWCHTAQWSVISPPLTVHDKNAAQRYKNGKDDFSYKEQKTQPKPA